jgi:hypothetical protein
VRAMIASGQLMHSNNDWKSSQQSAIEATGLQATTTSQPFWLVWPTVIYRRGERRERHNRHSLGRSLHHRIVASSCVGGRRGFGARILREHDFVDRNKQA